MSWFVAALRKYAVFGGRSRRKEFWYFLLFSFIAAFVLSLVDVAIGTSDSPTGTGLLGGIFSLAVLVPTIAVTVRRLHDVDRTGWWALLYLVPGLGIVPLVFALFDGTPGTNRFGPSPKAAVA